ncbi:MAG TPA: NAD(P)-binding domain-containing protein [Pyrinomonadaceae bacterium]|jgi:thioredoxin reductase (NADPH)|nr:NAD(P)-binding domain-containing protein [Pyrinomonadaceae bacterium]
MYELIIIGAGPGGISMAAEARAIGINAERILILEKGPAHSWAIRKFYPEAKAVLANYKGIDAICTGVMCISDMTKEETLTYLDRAIEDNALMVQYNEAVQTIRPVADGSFFVDTSAGSYRTQRCVIAIGILDKPNKPDYPIPFPLKERVHFDITSVELKGQDCLVVGGGDTAAEYCQYLVQQGNRVTLSYRRTEFARLNRVNHESLMAMEARGQVKILRGSNISQLEDEDGRPRVRFLESELPPRAFDHVIYSLGGTTPTNFLKTIGIDFVGNAPVLKEGYETSLPGLYLIGDLSAGKKGGSINLAFNMAADAMRHICSGVETSSAS